MELAFDTKSLRQLCESEVNANKRLGKAVTQKLISRLADLRAAISVNDLLAGRPREIVRSCDQRYLLDLCDCETIEFSANHVNNPLLKNCKIDWSQVTRIKIMTIGNSNG